ncbi:MAG: ABC transporter ATP-binding protein [Bacteroidota bacterium]
MKNFLLALRYAREYKLYSWLNIFFNILSAVFNLAILLLFIPFLKLIFNDGQGITVPVKPVLDTSSGWLNGYKDYCSDYFGYIMNSFVSSSGAEGALVFICLLILILFLLKNITRYMAMYYLAVVRNNVMRDLREKLFGKFIALPLGYYTEERKGDLITRFANDVYEVEVSVMSTLELIYREPFTIFISLLLMLAISPELTLFSLVLMPVSALIIGRVGRSLKRTSAKGQQKLGDVVSQVEEAISGLRIIKGFTAEQQVKKRFSKHNEWFNKLSIRLYRKRDLASPLSEFLGSAVLIALVWFGGKLILNKDSHLNGQEFIGFVIVFSQLLRPIQGIATAYSNINKGIASANRIDEVLNASEKIEEKQDAIEIKEFTSSVEFKSINFSYREAVVLKDVNFMLAKGKTIALVGPSGSGKSTIADLVPRFYDVVQGEVLLDGKNIKDYKLQSLRKLMGIVSQESILFNDSVAYNISLGDDNPDMKRVEEAAKIANAHEFIVKMERGYHSNIGDRGSKLSGGQRQRLAIARAVYKNPPILILDEATSALDTESEKLVQEALNHLMQNRTTLVIAHRLSTIQHANEILVLQNGEIVERGNHDQLYVKNGLYRKLCDMQSFS